MTMTDDMASAHMGAFTQQPTDTKVMLIKNFPLDKYDVGLEDSDPSSGWNRGFFKGQESLAEEDESERASDKTPVWMYAWLMEQGRVDEAAKVLYGISEQTGIPFEKLKREYNLNDYYEQNPHDYEYLEKDKQNTGWNRGFFNGQERLSESARKVYWPGASPDDTGDTDVLLDRSKVPYEDKLKDYEREQARIDAENANTNGSMIMTDESYDAVFGLYNEGTPYVDKDNYKRFLEAKRSRDLIASWVEVLVPIVYVTMLFVAGLWEVYMFVQGVDGLRPNWGLLLLPMILYVVYRSINSYSTIKMSF